VTHGSFPAIAPLRRYSTDGKAARNTQPLANEDPNASNIYGEAIIEKHFGRLAVFGDLGLAILTSPNALYSQNDEILYGAAFRYPINRRLTILGEVAGRQSTRAINTGLVGTNSTGQARLGMQITAGGLVWDFAGIGGLTKNDPHAGFTFGVSRDFQLFNWNKM
jgi:hypothetical protein